MTMLSSDCQGVLMAAVYGTSDNTEMSCEECACYTEITPEAFFEATGVSADSCGAGSGYSFSDEIEMCRRYMEHCDDSDSDESSMDDPNMSSMDDDVPCTSHDDCGE